MNAPRPFNHVPWESKSLLARLEVVGLWPWLAFAITPACVTYLLPALGFPPSPGWRGLLLLASFTAPLIALYALKARYDAAAYHVDAYDLRFIERVARTRPEVGREARGWFGKAIAPRAHDLRAIEDHEIASGGRLYTAEEHAVIDRINDHNA